MLHILHLADLHPRSRGMIAGKLAIDPATGNSVAMSELEESLMELVKKVQTGIIPCDLVLIAGDIFDSPHPTMAELAMMIDIVSLMADHVPVVMISGNHDIAQAGSGRISALVPFRYRKNIHVIETPKIIHLNTPSAIIHIVGLPYAPKGYLAQSLPSTATPEQINAEASKRLTAILANYAAEIDEQPGVKILLAHGTVGHATVGEQPRSIEYDVTLSTETFHHYDYVALGHIHKQQPVAENAWYCGSLTRQSFGDGLEEKGALLVSIPTTSGSKHVSVEIVPNACARHFYTISLDGARSWLNGRAMQGWNPLRDPVRIKDRLSEKDAQKANDIIAWFQRNAAFVQVDLEVEGASRSRDEEMSVAMSADDALHRYLKEHRKLGADEIGRILDIHREIVEEAT